MTDLRVVVEPHAPEAIKQINRDHLDVYNIAVTGLTGYYPVAIFLKDSNDEVLGGILGNIWGGWVHIMFVWVAEPLRGRGYWRALLQAMEQYAIERGCRA